MQRAEIVAYWRLKQKLGTFKKKAREMGVSLRAFTDVVSHYKANGALHYSNTGGHDGRRAQR